MLMCKRHLAVSIADDDEVRLKMAIIGRMAITRMFPLLKKKHINIYIIVLEFHLLYNFSEKIQAFETYFMLQPNTEYTYTVGPFWCQIS